MKINVKQISKVGCYSMGSKLTMDFGPKCLLSEFHDTFLWLSSSPPPKKKEKEETKQK